MKLDIHFNQEDIFYLDFFNLKDLKIIFERTSLEIDGINFDTDDASLQRLQMLSYLDKEIQFKDANNGTVTLSGSQIKTYIPSIESKLGERYEKINDLYNTYKVKLSAEEYITHYDATSGFFEYINDTSFSEDEYNKILDNSI